MAASRSSFTLRRLIVLGFIFLVFLSFCGTLVYFQLVHGEDYAAAGNAIAGPNVAIPASRGEIRDRNGAPLVINRQSDSIVLESARFPDKKEQEKRNEVILRLINLFESQNVPWIDGLPLIFDGNGQIAFPEDRESDVARMKGKDMLDLNAYATPQNCLDALIKLYKLGGYSPQDARKIASVCYALRCIQFRISNPYTFAEDVPSSLVALIMEDSALFPGVGRAVVPVREYAVEGKLMPHILGRVAAIDPDEQEKLQGKGYQLNDLVGKSGIESAMEDYLRGRDGKKAVRVDRDGGVTEEILREPEQGNTVVLTIDVQMQRVAYKALEQILYEYRQTKPNPVDPAGAMLVLNCKTGEVLASVSYPSYDITTYAENAAKLATDPNKALWNRCLQATYSPGSTIKPSVAIAGLEEGVINQYSVVRCHGIFEIAGQEFKCQQHHDNRNLTVISALKDSCNVFFYDTGLKLGIGKMNEYRTLFGLGQKTGVELPESAGILDSPAYRESVGQTWTTGLTVQAAIAQASNSFTVIQMANYCATIANGGTRYVPHFVKSIKSYDYSDTVLEKGAEIAVETAISQSSIALVKEGMRQVAATGYCRHYLSDLAGGAGAKTGTNQEDRKLNGVRVRINNGFLISFAPYEDPELAVFVLGDGFDSGTLCSKAARAVYDYYFSGRGESDAPQTENVLLG